MFSIKIHDGGSGEDFQKKPDFDECIYTSKATDETLKGFKEEGNKYRANMQSILLSNPEVINHLKSEKGNITKDKPSIIELIGKEEYSRVLRDSLKGIDFKKFAKQLKHEAVLNMNQI